jgi:NDP-sugar pyrophosphorylase family protein
MAQPQSLADVEAVVLAGGLGSRLRGVVRCPKVVAEVAGRPFLAHVLEKLREAGICRALLCTGVGGAQVAGALGDGARLGIRLRYAREPRPLGTAGALRWALASGALGPGPALVLNGDSLIDLDLAAFIDRHRRAGVPASVALAQVSDRGRFGAVITDAGGRIRAFREKRGRGPGLVNAGVYLLERAVLDAVAPGRPVSLEREVLPGLLGAGGVRGVVTGGPLVDIGTPASFRAAQGLFARGGWRAR